MTLTPTDMLEIQSAIDRYERKFPRRPAPSAEVALAWRLGKREAARLHEADLVSSIAESSAPEFAEQEPTRLIWVERQLRIRWKIRFVPNLDTVPQRIEPWVRGALHIGLLGMLAAVTASVFFFGALVGGFK